MEQKTKMSVLIIILAVFIAGSVYWIQKKKNTPLASVTPAAQTETDTPNANQKSPVTASSGKNLETSPAVGGKVVSIDEKTVSVLVAEGKIFAANINPKTPVITQGIEKAGTLADLKIGQNVAIKIDSENNAIQIIINK